jgi:hypothetical protein
MATIKACGGVWKPYARICSLIMTKPMGHASIAKIVGLNVVTVVRLLRALHSMELVHVPYWTIPVLRGSKPGEAWRLGYGVSEPCPLTLKGRESRQAGQQHLKLKTNWIAFANILRMLDRGATSKELREGTGLAEGSLRALRDYMHLDLKMIHVHDWRRRGRGVGGPFQPVFKIGRGIDAPKPEPLPMNTHRRNWRLRQKAKDQKLGYSVFSAHTPIADLALA